MPFSGLACANAAVWALGVNRRPTLTPVDIVVIL
jgi:hypothetical protein